MKRIIIALILVAIPVMLNAQEVTLTGLVKDDTGESLPGVSVTIEGTTQGVITNLDGEFRIDVDRSVAKTINFSFVGFNPESREITGEVTFFDIQLSPKYTELDDVVVIGYGTQRRGDVTVAISSVKPEDVASPVNTSLDQALQGQAAGVVVIQSTGKPGAPVSVRIRGTTSINGTNEPLYVVDGIPIITKARELTSGTLQGSDINPLSSINPADIESIQVLKDASAAAMYGARGANGVILITTKRGISGKLQVNLISTAGVQQLARQLELLNARELAELGNEAVTEARKYYPDVAYGDNFAFPDRFGEGTDWQGEIFRPAWMQNHQLSLRGGSEKTRYFMSANVMFQDGIIKNSDFNKGTFRINLDNDLSDKVRTGVNLNLTNSISHGVITGVPDQASSVTAMAMFFNPAQEPYDEDGPGGYTYESNTINRVPNPVAEINETDRVINSNRVIGDIYLDWDIKWPYVGVVNFWFFKPASDLDSNQAYYYFRMIEPDFTPLPVYEAMKTYTSQMPRMYAGTHQEDHWAVTWEGEWFDRSDAEAIAGHYRVAGSDATAHTCVEETEFKVLQAPASNSEAQVIIERSDDGCLTLYADPGAAIDGFVVDRESGRPWMWALAILPAIFVFGWAAWRSRRRFSKGSD